LSYEIVGCAFEVYNELGPGHSERTYQKAMAVMLKKRNLNFIEQLHAPVSFKDEKLNGRFMDFLVEEKVIVELKKSEFYSIKHMITS